MPTAPRTACANRTCPNLRPCPTHARAAERARGTRQQRGYNATYDRARAWWKPRVETGLIDCHAPTCLMPIRRILIGAAWDLGHDDRRVIRGPEHEKCNRSAGGKNAHH